MVAADLVGRDDELQAVGRQLERCRAGESVLTLVEGEAGIGKTRLVQELAGQATRCGLRVVWVEADEVARPPLGLCAGVVRGLGSFSTPDPALAASQRRWEALDALAAVLRDAAPVLVVLEDVHWADPDSLWVLERLPRQLGEAAVCLVATSRTDEPGVTAVAGLHQHGEVVSLRGLTVAAVGQLAAVVAGDRDVDAYGLAARTGGSPLFVRELLALGDDRDLPPAISAVLERHLHRLDPSVLRTVTALALAGPAVTIEILASAVGSDAVTVADHLEVATTARILRPSPGSCARFRHALYAETAVAATTAAQRRALHAGLAAAWSAHDDRAARVAAAEHRLAALPLGDAQAAGDEALAVVLELAAAGDAAGAAGLASVARDRLEAHGGVARELLGRLAFAQGDALWETGARPAAIAAYEHAAAHAAGGRDTGLLTASEAAAARLVDPFVCDVERIHRLLACDAQLPAGDHPARVAVLGRLAVLHTADPALIGQGHAFGDRAVAMARRLGDAELLVGALTDRHLVPAGLDGFAAREEAADEIVTLGERMRRTDLAAFGREWQFEERFERRDRHGAERALDQLHLYGMVMPSPEWRYKALFRRSTLHLCDGDRAAALDLIAQVVALGTDLVTEEENVGLELAARSGIRLQWGLPDARHDELAQWAQPRLADVPPFVRITVASADWARSDTERVRAVVEGYVPAAARLLASYRGASLVGLLAAMAADLGHAQHAAALRAVLAPYRGRIMLGLGVPMAYDSILGRLASLEGDHPAAIEHHRAAVAALTGMPLPGLVPLATAHLAEALAQAGDAAAVATRAEAERLAGRFGMVLPGGDRRPAVAPVGPAGRAWLRRLSDGWQVDSPHGQARLPDSRGLAHLARLVSTPGVEVPATELAGMVGEIPVAADLGPVLDARAKREYRRRVVDLQDDIDEAEAANDSERAALARIELDALLDELRRAVGLGGRDRPSGSGAERARVNVTRNLKRAIAAIAEVAPGLGAHLERSVRTGRYCAYDPEPAAALAWSVDTGG